MNIHTKSRYQSQCHFITLFNYSYNCNNLGSETSTATRTNFILPVSATLLSLNVPIIEIVYTKTTKNIFGSYAEIWINTDPPAAFAHNIINAELLALNNPVHLMGQSRKFKSEYGI